MEAIAVIPRQDGLPEPDDRDSSLWRVIFISSLLVLACMWASDAEGRMIAEPTPRDIVTCARPLTPTRIAFPQAGAASPQAAPAVPGEGWSICRASWYGPGFYGNWTAGGAMCSPDLQGVAHKSLAFGTLVTLRYNGREITVPVVDRGPYIPGRMFDLCAGTAAALGFQGVQTVEYRIGG
ncbi:MAG: septal ring lytic transglycosylase RlpA family protein [Coriobacteriia bacterium]